MCNRLFQTLSVSQHKHLKSTSSPTHSNRLQHAETQCTTCRVPCNASAASTTMPHHSDHAPPVSHATLVRGDKRTSTPHQNSHHSSTHIDSNTRLVYPLTNTTNTPAQQMPTRCNSVPTLLQSCKHNLISAAIQTAPNPNTGSAEQPTANKSNTGKDMSTIVLCAAAKCWPQM